MERFEYAKKLQQAREEGDEKKIGYWLFVLRMHNSERVKIHYKLAHYYERLLHGARGIRRGETFSKIMADHPYLANYNLMEYRYTEYYQIERIVICGRDAFKGRYAGAIKF